MSPFEGFIQPPLLFPVLRAVQRRTPKAVGILIGASLGFLLLFSLAKPLQVNDVAHKVRVSGVRTLDGPEDGPPEKPFRADHARRPLVLDAASAPPTQK